MATNTYDLPMRPPGIVGGRRPFSIVRCKFDIPFFFLLVPTGLLIKEFKCPDFFLAEI